MLEDVNAWTDIEPLRFYPMDHIRTQFGEKKQGAGLSKWCKWVQVMSFCGVPALRMGVRRQSKYIFTLIFSER